MDSKTTPAIPHPPKLMTFSKEVNLDTNLSAYDYELPPELIAQNPAVPRDSARLLVAPTKNGDAPRHQVFRDLPNLLLPGDLLVMNNTRVIPARLSGRKSSGALVGILLLEEQQPNCWLALVKPGRHFKVGAEILFSSIKATVIAIDPATGGRLLEFHLPQGVSLLSLLDTVGEVPLPPYITTSTALSEQYQTIYAQHPGAVAAPTAGLHFTPELLQELQSHAINQAFVTLHVGVGTFRPVEVADVTTHKMHQEWIEVPSVTIEQIRQTKQAGGRIIAVGTTVVRALETSGLQTFSGKTDLFIYPGYTMQVVDGLITNFHLPKSSLLMLVSALIGRKQLLQLYAEAIAHRYRFYSFGDAMLIPPIPTSK